MKRKTLGLVVVAVIAAVVLFVHYASVWVSVTCVVSLAVGCIAGWLARVFYNKLGKE